ncbi:MAG: PEP-CTERM sorting domain-containing protein [Candidatus Accumulibacter propinquus]|jgi:hypothetical protein|uniref:PEP-CTERM sorting domain-containing protein n=1 Tax=Candidatus Accumulibacter propinquus TaxID=2954380 RepID=UPI002FC354BC
MRLSKISTALLAAIGIFSATAASAGPAWEFSTASNSFSNGSWVFATAFTVNTNVTASGLGYYADPNTGFVDANQVALYKCSNATCTGTGSLLASATVDNTYALTGHFRYVTISSLLLEAGQSYEVVGVSHSNNYTWANAGFGTDSAISIVGDGVGTGNTRWESDSGSGPKFLNYVNYGEIESDGFWGPNVFLGLPTFTGNVPEPSSVALLGLALFGLTASRRRKSVK